MCRTVVIVRFACYITLAASLAVGAVVAAAPAVEHLLVVCSPGSPGTTDEAQPRMDALAAALSANAGTTIKAVYDPSEVGGTKRIANAAIAIVSLPFFLEHEKDLKLHARLAVVQEGRPALERWSLVAQKGRITRPDDLAGFTIASTAGFAPGFVRGAVQSGLGALPSSVKVVTSSAVLSALRRAANGEDIAVLLDGSQAASLASLPFASKLEVVTRSPPAPAGLVVTADARMPAKTWTAIESALVALPAESAGAAALTALQIEKFVPVEDKSLAGARRAYESAR